MSETLFVEKCQIVEYDLSRLYFMGELCMSKKVNFYLMSMNLNDRITNYQAYEFLRNIENTMFAEQNDGNLVREIQEKTLRMFPFHYTTNGRQFVIPFGKLKEKNKPYWINLQNNRLEEVPMSLFDINSLGIDMDYGIALYTTNRDGPTIQNVEEYLNTFIQETIGLKISFVPIQYNTGIEKVRNAKLVRNITLNLDLGKALNGFYLGELEDNAERGLMDAFRNLAEFAKDDAEGKTLSLTLGLGRGGKKTDTLNLESMLYLLEHINVGAEFIKEILVNYKNGDEEKIDTARLKDTNMLLFYTCTGTSENQISPETLRENINMAVADKIVIITRSLRDYHRNVIQYNAEGLRIVTHWDEQN